MTNNPRTRIKMDPDMVTLLLTIRILTWVFVTIILALSVVLQDTDWMDIMMSDGGWMQAP
jgi:hypothetical protein